MRILVIGGMHGNEPLGLAVVRLFKQKPIKDVDVMLANEQAVAAKSRYIAQDLNRTFPGDDSSENYESRRAAQLLNTAKRYDLVLDFHNTYCPNNDCGFLGQSATELLYRAAVSLDLKRIIVADYDCINKHAPNCLSVEISLDSPQNKPGDWYERITQLSGLDSLDNDTSNLEKYRFVYRMTLEDKEKLDLVSKDLKAFQAMDTKLANRMGLKSPAFPIFIGDRFTPYDFGGVLNRL
jgi:hypothetical protein